MKPSAKAVEAPWKAEVTEFAVLQFSSTEVLVCACRGCWTQQVGQIQLRRLTWSAFPLGALVRGAYSQSAAEPGSEATDLQRFLATQ